MESINAVLNLIIILMLLRARAKKPKRKYVKKIVPVVPEKKKKKTDGRKSGWHKRRMGKAQKAIWANYTPEQRQARIDKLKRARQIKKEINR